MAADSSLNILSALATTTDWAPTCVMPVLSNDAAVSITGTGYVEETAAGRESITSVVCS